MEALISIEGQKQKVLSCYIKLSTGVGTTLSKTGPASSGDSSQGVSHKGNGGGEGYTLQYIK